MTTRSDVLISAEELSRILATGTPVTVLDVRWRLDRPDGRDDHRTGHIPSAVYVSLEDELSDHAVSGRGRHPLPSGGALERNLRTWGVREGVPVVVYDDWNRAGSARAWWVLTAAGVADVRILDGGLAAWRAAAGALKSGATTPPPGDVTAAHRDLYDGARSTVTAEDLRDFAGRGVLVDARAPERYRGEVEPVDPVAGHIPGAVNVPNIAILDDEGRFRPAAEVRALFAAAGADVSAPLALYCGSGVTAAVGLAALAAAGIDAALFPGSWSQWSGEPSNPVAVGRHVGAL
ncbi:rhodanese-like domain-containing protein [Rhodococcus sp. YH1]|uniref:rhodanese-like domain-containing protein n=1 Tax=Rhodococcus sp. YH1 TaxID=89066 RepID=UPI0013872808|nr:putative thiosulfate sulfurtransferase SseB [Rhodococcus sp. YH1]